VPPVDITAVVQSAGGAGAVFITPPIKYCAVPSGDITAVVQLPGGAAQYLIGASIIAASIS